MSILTPGTAELDGKTGRRVTLPARPEPLSLDPRCAALIVVDFNYLRKHGTEDDTILLATGIFVSIVNIFVSLLNIFSR